MPVSLSVIDVIKKLAGREIPWQVHKTKVEKAVNDGERNERSYKHSNGSSPAALQHCSFGPGYPANGCLFD
jgi:hypothetical protein